jgi:hypothetical protein
MRGNRAGDAGVESEGFVMARSTSKPVGRVTQFNWRRQWSKKVAPHLHHELVQDSLDLGMMMLDPNWQRGDQPYLLGGVPLHRRRVVTGKLSWYQVWNRCHWIAFFSMAIGVLNYPDLDWRFLSGDLHTVPVGYGPNREPRVIMDILLFDAMTADESLALCNEKVKGAPEGKGWNEIARLYVSGIVPLLRATSSPSVAA